MFEPILPNDLLNIVNEYAQLTIRPTDKQIDILIVQNMLNCWAPQLFRSFDALCDVCATTDLELIKWLCYLVSPKDSAPVRGGNIWKFLQLTHMYNHQKYIAYPLRIACIVGNKKIIKWLIKFFEYSSCDVRYMNDYCLIALCFNKHLETAQWLIKRYNIKKINVDYRYDYTLSADASGKIPVKIINGQALARAIRITQEKIEAYDRAKFLIELAWS
jgi:hypothetical protein